MRIKYTSLEVSALLRAAAAAAYAYQKTEDNCTKDNASADLQTIDSMLRAGRETGLDIPAMLLAAKERVVFERNMGLSDR